MLEQEWIEGLQDVGCPHSGADMHTQRFAGVFVEYGQHLVWSARAQLVMHEVHAPDMVAVLRAEPDDRAVFVVEAFALLMALRQLQAFLAP